MTDTYQPIYDAVRSRIQGCDIGAAVADALRTGMDASYAIQAVAQDFHLTAAEHRRPSAVYRPAIKRDGDQWCVLYGENLMDGVTGFGNTPDQAMVNFDIAWLNQKAAMEKAHDK